MDEQQARRMALTNDRWKDSHVAAVQLLTPGSGALPVYVCPSCAALVADRAKHDTFHPAPQELGLY